MRLFRGKIEKDEYKKAKVSNFGSLFLNTYCDYRDLVPY